jgi:hypothetical protein
VFDRRTVRRVVAAWSAVLVVAAAAAAATAQPAGAARGLLKGLYDDTQTLYGNPDRTYTTLKQLRTKIVRINMYWGGEYGVANRRPARPTDPEDPAYDWGLYDRAVRYAETFDVQVIFSIWGTPGWANRFRGLRYAPVAPRDLQNFAYAAAKRYSGTYEITEQVEDADGNTVEVPVTLPRVRYWLAWNEPNNPAFLFPQYRLVKGKATLWSPRDYAKICNAVRAGIKLTLIRNDKVGCGVTSPSGNNNPRTLRPSVSPLPFLRGMKRFGARGFDAYAHHPYYGSKKETPSTKPPKSSNAVRLGNISDLTKELTRLYGRGPRLWLTEYGYQTRPDKAFAVTLPQQARYMSQAYAIARKNPRIDMLIWFMLRDDRNLSLGWQSGLLTAGGSRKPAFTTFQRIS